MPFTVFDPENRDGPGRNVPDLGVFNLVGEKEEETRYKQVNKWKTMILEVV